MKKLLWILPLLTLSWTGIKAQDDTYAPDIQVTVNPPALPYYDQPPCPVEGYLWTPGYWAWGPLGYYWVPGVWVAPPEVGFLWTPGYWAFVGGYYRWHIGYWGPHVGFYGGIYYGWGYTGVGFYGGVWEGRVFRYNTAVCHVNTTVIHNTYADHVNVNNSSRVSFNGKGGITAQPTAAEKAAMAGPKVHPTSAQVSHQQAASQDKSQLASNNHGKPATTAMNKVNGERFSAEGHPATSNAPAKSPAPKSQPATKSSSPATSHNAPAVNHNAPAPGHNTAPSSGNRNPGPPANHNAPVHNAPPVNRNTGPVQSTPHNPGAPMGGHPNPGMQPHNSMRPSGPPPGGGMQHGGGGGHPVEPAHRGGGR